VSQYDYNPFKYIDKNYYFRLNESNEFTSLSGCGNDFMTERPMARRLIIESVKYWMTEYHIDGFRFDLAYLIDIETCKEIIKEARKINPNVYIIAEPWGGGYDPAGFSRIGWAAWNDKFRNAVKGQNPFDNTGFIFGNWERENNPQSMPRYITGTLASDGGLFQEPSHAINYLESHDDHTLGDFIRIGIGAVDAHDRIQDMIKHVKLTEKQLKLNKLAALFLFTSQGAVMIGQGQEFARSKVIAETDVPDPDQGRIDHNSYNKDNETNYINYYHKELNDELYQYYKGLIALRKKYPAFRSTPKSNISFLNCENEFGLGFHIQSMQESSFIVIMNGHHAEDASFKLPEGKWALITNDRQAGIEVIGNGLTGHITVAPTTGMIFKSAF
jgi:pullulanase/glycogen debranching enzyme